MREGAGNRLDRAVSVALATAALAMAAAVVYREFVPRVAGAMAGSATLQGGTYHQDWQDLLRFGRYIGDTGAPIQLIEFADLECPACRGFHLRTLPLLREEFGPQVGLAIIHLPLAIHRFARAAAQAAECAAEQGWFGPFVEVTFAKQDSLGLKPWSSFAEEAKVPDGEAFSQCIARPDTPPLVDSGMAAGRRLGIHATPTVLVNGWRVASPSAGELARVVKEISANRVPYPVKNARSR